MICKDQFVPLKYGYLGKCIPYIDNQVGHQAFTIDNIDSKIAKPSSLANNGSAARSGCGIKPNTLRASLHIPAMFSIDPLGFDSAVILPSSSQYLNNTWSLSFMAFKTSTSAK